MKMLKKLAVFLPVLLLTGYFLWLRFLPGYRHDGPIKLLAISISIGIFYLFVAVGVWRRPQSAFFDVLLQSGFYLYIFSVLTLTGYFILFRQISLHGWWNTMLHRVDTLNRINLKPFSFLKGDRWMSYDTVGNFIMLLPLGIYLPLLYKKMKSLFAVTFTALLISVSIELLQLASNFRVTDINDVILNTSGAALGYILYAIAQATIIKPLFSSANSFVLKERTG